MRTIFTIRRVTLRAVTITHGCSFDAFAPFAIDDACGVRERDRRIKLEHLGVLEFGLYANVYSGQGIGCAAIRYDRNSYYHDYRNLFDAFWSGQVQYEMEF